MIYSRFLIHLGDITTGGVTYDPNQRTLTCISTGGPATTVTWTRDSTTVTEGNQTVLVDATSAEYVHTLTVTGIERGLYRCIVANNKPSSHSACIVVTVQPSPVTILPLNATAVRVSWTSSLSFNTFFQYTSSCSASGLVITRYTTVLPAGVGVIDITLDDEYDGYEHNFTLHYTATMYCGIYAPVTQVDFAFGKWDVINNSCSQHVSLSDKQYFQIQFGPIDFCLEWGVSYC